MGASGLLINSDALLPRGGWRELPDQGNLVARCLVLLGPGAAPLPDVEKTKTKCSQMMNTD